MGFLELLVGTNPPFLWFFIFRVLHAWNHIVRNFLGLACFPCLAMFPYGSFTLQCVSVVGFLSGDPSMVWIYHCLVNHSLVEGFHCGAIRTTPVVGVYVWNFL